MNAFSLFMAASAAEQASADSSGIFPPLDTSTFSSQLFWLALTFGLLLFLLAKVLLPRVGSILEDRSNRIADDLDSAARMQRDAELAEKAYDQALSDARAKAHNVSETTRASITAEINAELETAEAEAAERTEQAEIKIRKMRAQALSNVDDIAAQTAKNLIEKLYSKTVSITVANKAVKAQS